MSKAVVLEDSNGLWKSRSQQNKTPADKLSRFAYKKMQEVIITKAIEYNVPALLVDPKNNCALNVEQR